MKRRRLQWSSDKPSMTQQHKKAECDVNSILEKYRKTGQINHIRTKPGQYGDFSGHQDFRSSLDKVLQANNAFNSLPAVIRKRFGNDPEQLVQFLDDNKNYEEAEKLGFVVKKAETKQEPKNDDQTTTNQGSNTAST